MTGEDWKVSHTTPHSLHGSPADIIASILDDSSLGETFSPTDENEISHWRRRDRYDVDDADLPIAKDAPTEPTTRRVSRLGTAFAASCRLRQPLRAGFTTVARLRTQGAKGSVGCRDMRMLQKYE